MSLQLFGHPFRSYTWKVLIALWADGTLFTFRMLGPDHPENGDEHPPLAVRTIPAAG